MVRRPKDGPGVSFAELVAGSPLLGVIPEEVKLASPTPTLARCLLPVPEGPLAIVN